MTMGDLQASGHATTNFGNGFFMSGRGHNPYGTEQPDCNPTTRSSQFDFGVPARLNTWVPRYNEFLHPHGYTLDNLRAHMPFPLVIELQKLAISRDTSVLQLVRTAKLVAVKLGLTDASEWIDQELNGYDNLSNLPSYRILTGECRAFNPFNGFWMHVQFPDAQFQRICSEGRVGQSLGSMESILVGDAGHAFLNFAYEQQQILQKLFQEQTKFAIRVTKGQLEGIFDAVRNLVLDWSLRLEQAGVLGENMSFTLNEKQEAKPVSQQFFIQNAGVVGNVTDNATVTNNQTVHGSLSVDRVFDLVSQAKSALSGLPSEMAAKASEILNEIDRESHCPTPNEGKLRVALTSLRTVCEGTTGNLVASGITAAVTALLT
ncbi:hypothetical protein PQQ51_32495 [Paraburkholderia xenovorans]|uniref:AbiTii domain-containing protein n=1 Tax=Paraburkholderia xenovorans TaxID=36873 RepID=UPI0038BB7460